MAGQSALFRLTTAGQTEATVGSTEKVEFNDGVVPDANGQLVSSSFEMNEDLSFHPNPNRHLTQIQDGKLGTIHVVLAGYIKAPASSLIAINFYNWMKQDKTNSAFPFGRFGLRVNDFPDQINLTPSATAGYILHYTYWERPEDYAGIATMIAKLYRNGTP